MINFSIDFFFSGEGITGPLTQRLVAALMEENVMPEKSPQSLQNIDTAGEATAASRTMSMLKNGVSIEKRVQRELIEQGLLDPEDIRVHN